MDAKNRCAHCKRLYVPNPRARNQRYCGRDTCQRARKAKWQRDKLARDDDYRMGHEDAQQRWRKSHPDYWQQYREDHPEYRERNRRLQKQRDAKRRAKRLAKMDASAQAKPVKSGTYYLIPLCEDLAKMDASTQRITIISSSYRGP